MKSPTEFCLAEVSGLFCFDRSVVTLHGRASIIPLSSPIVFLLSISVFAEPSLRSLVKLGIRQGKHCSRVANQRGKGGVTDRCLPVKSNNTSIKTTQINIVLTDLCLSNVDLALGSKFVCGQYLASNKPEVTLDLWSISLKFRTCKIIIFILAVVVEKRVNVSPFILYISWLFFLNSFYYLEYSSFKFLALSIHQFQSLV